MKEKVTVRILTPKGKRKTQMKPGVSLASLVIRLRSRYNLSRSLMVRCNGMLLTDGTTFDTYITRPSDRIRLKSRNRASVKRPIWKILFNIGTVVKFLILKNKDILRQIMTTIAQLSHTLIRLIHSKQNYFLKIITQPISRVDVRKVKKMDIRVDLRGIVGLVDSDKTITDESEGGVLDVSLTRPNAFDFDMSDNGSAFDNFINRSNIFYQAFNNNDSG
jgi:hypothetical protein